MKTLPKRSPALRENLRHAGMIVLSPRIWVGLLLLLNVLTVVPAFAQSGTRCFTSSSFPSVYAKSDWSTNGDTITIRTTLSRSFVDNTYGTGAIGWPNGHKFSELTGSDFLQLALFNTANTKVLEFKMDYFTASTAAPSGYKSLGVTGGDGGMVLGTASNIYSVTTSIDVNFNTFGYVLTSNSPATDTTFSANPAFPNWIYSVWYEVKVRKSAFGAAGFLQPSVSGVHASPSKVGSNTVTVTPNSCPVGSIGNFVWFDFNQNGIQDAGESGVQGVTVKLFNCNGTTPIATTTTDVSGSYLFNNLEIDKSYYLVFDPATLPSGYALTSRDQGSNNNVDSDADPVTGQTDCEYISANENNLTYDAGLVDPTKASIGNFVWNDLDEDGIQDAGEPGVENVTVKLYTCAGALIATTTTNSTGAYGFGNLTAGSYYISFTLPSGASFTQKNAGSNGALDSDADPVTGNTVCETLVAGENNTTYDAGIKVPVEGEACFISSSLPGVAFAKTKWYSVGDTIIFRTTLSRKFVDNTYGTGAIGWPSGHTFSNLTGSDNLQLALYNNSNTKILEFKQDYITSTTTAPSGYKSLGVSGGDGGMILGSSANILGASSSLDENFNKYGYILTVNSPVTDTNYTINASYPNWEYTVWYEIKVRKSAFGTAGFSYPLITGIHASPSKVGSNTVPVVPGPCPVGSIGDRVWRDNNNNGIQDPGEPGVPGVTVRLYNCMGNVLVGTTTTDANGNYLFSDLTVDVGYYVMFDLTTAPAGFVFSPKDQGSNDGNDSDADPVTGRTVCENITANENNLTYDAGLYLPVASIGDFVWNDLDRDGIQDSGEPGIPNVTVRLYDCTTNVLIATTVTNAAGAYLFSDLPAGSYYLVFDQGTLPAGFVAAPQNQGGNPALDSDANPSTGQTACETLVAGENNTTYDAGFFLCNVIITCPANLNVQCDNQVPTPNIYSVTASSSCGSVTVTWEGDQTSPGTCPKVITRTYKATATNGNSATCTQTITVDDTQPPVISAPPYSGPVACPNTPVFSSPSVHDNCDPNPQIVLVSEVTVPGACPGVYAVTRTWKAIDQCGNESGTVSQTINVTDTQAPSIGQPGANATVSCPNTVSFTPPTASDACDPNPTIVLVSDVTTPGSCPGLYSRTRRWKAVDCSGNQSATVSQTITVVDNTAPTIGPAGANYTVECNDPVVFTPPAATDACDASPSIILVSDVTSPGTCPGNYTRTKTWKAVDCSGNQSASVSQTITVVDNTAPSIGAPGPNITINCPATPVFTPPTATDACDPYVNVVLLSDVTTPGSCPGVYSRTRTWKAVDCSGNQSSSVSQTITVVDNTAPVIGQPGANATLTCPATPVFTPPTASDACDPGVQVVLLSDVTIPGSCPGVYSRTRIWKAVDCSGNQSASVSQTITVVDNTAPTITPPSLVGTLQCPATPTFITPTATDQCDPNPTVVLVSDVTTPGPCPGLYNRTKSWKAVDCSGNESPVVVQSFTVIDNTPPTIGPAGPNMTIACTATANFTAPIATDLCDGTPTVVLVSEVTNTLSCPPGNVGSPYSVTRTWKAVDCSGNESPTVSQTITYDCCQEIYPPICLTSATKPDKVGGSITTTVSGDTLTIRVTLAKTFVDNTYGTGAIGWSNGHTFSNLTGSDNLQLALLNKNGTKVLEFKMDYITSTSTAPSGFRSLGVSGGDGGMILGAATNIYKVETSMDRNFNAFGYILTTNSPATNATYTPNPSYPNWIYDVWYEVKVKKSAFGAIGFGKPLVTSIHASPSKTGSNTEPVIECPLFSTTKTNEQCGLPCSGSINVTTNSGLPPFTFTWSDGSTSEDRANLCPGTYTVTVTDAFGSVASSTVTVAAAPAPPCNVNEICFASPTKGNIVNAKSTWTENGDTITIRTTLAKTFVDNTYGTSAIGWTNGHKFGDLVGSDNLQLALYNTNGTKVLDFKMDYISPVTTLPSGYKSLGVSGGSGSMVLGSASNIYSVVTSLDVNFNNFGYVLTTNSPATNSSYAPNATYPNWIYEVWYEVKVKKSAFGTAGFGYPKITGTHASPSKTGSNSEPVDSVPCINTIPSRISDASTDVEKLALTLAPNPANEMVRMSFLGVENGSVLVILTGMDGKMIDMIYRGEVEAGLVYQMDYSTSHLAPGLYLLNFRSEGVQDSKRLMIVR